ncbi:cytoplasmic protein [Bacillus toyonensis]|uniref:Cytoplasmic protein n=1 Tax=Bacillus toyonensis TaxID=155322 RepID=A0A2C4JWI5_9BACI|nr:cytoplasmic protein [Bacillus toyonensis]PFY54905.1 cytoplasmic protein [Bacillus toyonensis]PGG86353.1 cytoplasmic protein [Bacillus toyonensis]PHC95615.1 cytoplasmic protein [Bacillus toyonensis]
MINAIGIAVILSYDFNNKNKVYLNKSNALIEIIKSKNMIDYGGNPVIELTCKYSILIDRDADCKSLDDYAGKVFPFLSSVVEIGLVRNENYHFAYTDATTYNQPQPKHIKEIIEDLLTNE